MISLSYLIDQVCSFEDALALKKIGVTQNSLHYWFYLSDSNISPKIALSGTNCLKDENKVSAFSTAELGELLLNEVPEYKVYLYPPNMFNGQDINGSMQAATEATLRARMLFRALKKKNRNSG